MEFPVLSPLLPQQSITSYFLQNLKVFGCCIKACSKGQMAKNHETESLRCNRISKESILDAVCFVLKAAVSFGESVRQCLRI